MTNSDIRRYEMFVRVRDFGEAHAALFPRSTLAQEQIAVVDAAVKALGSHAVTKMAASREGKSPKAAARVALLGRLEAIALTGRAIAKAKPELADKFRIPRSQPDQALITTGRLFATDAEMFKAEFLAHAMSKSFIDDLTKAVDDFEAAIQARDQNKGATAGVRALIKAALSDGMAAVSRLDAIVMNHFGSDPKLMAVWKRERRVGATRRRTSPAAAATPAASSSATAAAPTTTDGVS